MSAATATTSSGPGADVVDAMMGSLLLLFIVVVADGGGRAVSVMVFSFSF
jgi:hypothetical protein